MANRADDPKYPYSSTGKKSFAEPIRLDRGNVYKGQLHYDAQFVPAVALKWDEFTSTGTELDRIVDADDEDSDANSTGTYEREKIPEGVTTAKAIAEGPEGEESPVEQNGNGTKAKHSKKDSVGSVRTTGTTNTTGTGGTMETAATGPPVTPSIEMPKEELFTHRM